MEEFELLDILKHGLLNVTSLDESHFGSLNKNLQNSLKAQNYYLLNIEDNLYNGEKPSCKLGKGTEAIRSSAAMIYNTLGNGDIKIEGISYQAAEPLYERPFMAIKDDNDSKHTAKLDASLITSDGKHLLLIEAKCMEWFDKKPKSLKNAYLNSERYLYPKAAQIFIPIFMDLINYDATASEQHPKTIRYDAIQMTIHALGIYNYCLSDANKPGNIKLLNVVWDVRSSKEYIEEENEGMKYINSVSEKFSSAFKELGVNFYIDYESYSDFVSKICDSGQKKYLSRYDAKLHIGLDEEVFGYNKTVKLSDLRKTANKYKASDANIEKTKQKHALVYNCQEEQVAVEILKEVYPDLPDDFKEVWKFVPDSFYDFYKVKNLRYEVSNLGRIRIGNKYLLQADRESKRGYLVIGTQNINCPEAVNHSIELYKFIAETFLGNTRGKEIHHIDNNGYDCRPENLILLSTRQHSKAHGYYMSKDDRKWELK